MSPERTGSRDSLAQTPTPGGVRARRDPQARPLQHFGLHADRSQVHLSEASEFPPGGALLSSVSLQHHHAIHFPGGLLSIGKRRKLKEKEVQAKWTSSGVNGVYGD